MLIKKEAVLIEVARHLYLVSLANKLKRDGQFTKEEMYTIICKANDSFNEPLDKNELKIIKRIII